MKTYISIYLFIAVFLLSACSRQAKTPPPQSDTAAAQPEIEASTEKSEIEKQIEFFSANFERWKAEDETDWWGYAVTDLDQNGRLEVITSEDHGTGHFVTTSIREVNSSFDDLVMCGKDHSCDVDVLERLAADGGPQLCGPLITPLLNSSSEPQIYSVYYDGEADLYHYIFSDSINYKGEWYGIFTVQRSFCLQDGEAAGALLSYERYNYAGIHDYWDVHGNYVDAETCRTAASDYYSGMAPLEAKIFWISGRRLGEANEGERYELLKHSIDSFCVDGRK